jgi:hypothetical protein
MKKAILLGTGVAVLMLPAFARVTSGLDKGENISAFHPNHVSGPLANSTKCFPCTFKQRPQVQVWVNADDMKNVASLASTLEKAVGKNKKAEFKAMIVFVVDAAKVDSTKKLVGGSAAAKANPNVAMAVLAKNDSAVESYKFNTGSDVKNTVFVYKNWKVTDKMVNVKADAAGVKALETAIAAITK